MNPHHLSNYMRYLLLRSESNVIYLYMINISKASKAKYIPILYKLYSINICKAGM